MKLAIRYAFLHQRKSFDGYVQSLMPLKTARKNDDDLVVRAGALAPVKKARVYVIKENGAFFFRNRAREQFFIPQMIRDDYIIDKGCGGFLDKFKERDIKIAGSGVELVGKQFWHDVVNVQNYPRPSHFRVPRGENQKIRKVVHVHHVVFDAVVAFGHKNGRDQQKAQQSPRISPLPALV